MRMRDVAHLSSDNILPSNIFVIYIIHHHKIKTANVENKEKNNNIIYTMCTHFGK